MSEASELFNFGNKVDVVRSSKLFVLSNQEKAIVNQTDQTRPLQQRTWLPQYIITIQDSKSNSPCKLNDVIQPKLRSDVVVFMMCSSHQQLA